MLVLRFRGGAGVRGFDEGGEKTLILGVSAYEVREYIVNGQKDRNGFSVTNDDETMSAPREGRTMNELQTERLFLTPYTVDDLEHVVSLRRNKHVWVYSTNTADPSIERATIHLNALLTQYHNREYAPFALFTGDKTYIGEAGVYHGNRACNKINIGYNLLPRFWGHGFATEITKALIHWYFTNTETQRIEGTVLEENVASRRVLEKSQMALEGILRKFTRIHGEYKNLCYYSILREEYAFLPNGGKTQPAEDLCFLEEMS
jgi:ribosomal-protein-alanine N-acetyltransferase